MYVDGRYVPERRGNPLVRSPRGGRILSAMQLPWFTTMPPKGFGVLTMTGRKTGKTRRRCVRAIQRTDRIYLVAIGGPRAAWLKNVRATPHVELRVRGGRRSCLARLPRDADELEAARAAFCETVNLFDYVECAVHRPGRPTRARIVELHTEWFEHGSPLIAELVS
jgi:deazaflavin-dependent oxidoreductase (nitroreductase family)